MKKILFIIALFTTCIVFGQYKPLSPELIKEKYPNGACAYWDINSNMLFNGGDYDKNHPDAHIVKNYICNHFSGDFFMSSCYEEHYKVDVNGNIEPIYDQIKTETNKIVARFYWSNDGKLSSTICWDEEGNEIDCN